MVKCLICGIEKEFSIVEHLKFSHNMKSVDYKLLYPDSKVKSELYLTKLSERQKKLWENDDYKNKQIKIRNITHKDPIFRQKMSNTLKKIHNENPNLFSGFTQWSKTEKFKKWVISAERIEKISKTTKERWENPEYKTKARNSIKKKLSDGRCKKSIEYRENMSKKISELYSLGVLYNEKNKYKTGKYNSKNNDEFIYASSYELESMKIFDNTDWISSWTNKHNIRIKYYYNELNRHYVPDFLVDFKNGKSYIIEMKGWHTEEVDVKEFYTKKIYPNYHIFYNINELKIFID
jgi:hypothetical protein